MKAKWRRIEPSPALFPEMDENPWGTGREKEAAHEVSGLTTLELCAGARTNWICHLDENARAECH